MDKTVVTGKTDGFEMFDHDEISNWRLLCLPNQSGRQSCIAEIQRHLDLNARRTVGDIGYGSTYRTKTLGLHPERAPNLQASPRDSITYSPWIPTLNEDRYLIGGICIYTWSAGGFGKLTSGTCPTINSTIQSMKTRSFRLT